MMGITDTVKATGRVRIERRDASGALVEIREFDNLVVTTGRNLIASRMKDASATLMSHMAVGSGAVAAALADTALGSELGRVALTSTTNTTNNIVYVATFPAGTGTGALTEAGLFNAGAVGTMLARVVFGTMTKNAGDDITITWTVTFS